ncbi:MAG: rod shape-determining protein MreD [Clostridiales bacterium]
MKIKIFIYCVCLFIIMIIQSTILDSLALYNVKPNLVLVFIISVSLVRGGVEGAYVGFFAGLIQDFITGKVIGFYALIGMYVGLLVGIFNKRLYRENFLVIIFFTFTATIVYELCVFFFGIYLQGGDGFLYGFVKIILPETLYNIIVSVFMYVFIMKLSEIFNEQDKKIRKY